MHKDKKKTRIGATEHRNFDNALRYALGIDQATFVSLLKNRYCLSVLLPLPFLAVSLLT